MFKLSSLKREYKIFVPLALLFLVLLVLMPRARKFNYEYRKGSPWMYETLVAQFDFPILKTEAEMQAAREKSQADATPYYKYRSSVSEDIERSLSSRKIGGNENLKPEMLHAIESIYEKGVISDRDVSGNSNVIYIQKDKRAVRCPISDVYTLSDAREVLAASLKGLVPNPDSLCAALGIYDLLVPNLIYDEEATRMVHGSAAAVVSPTSGAMTAGTVIVSHEEIVTAEIQQLLDSYKAEYNSNYGYNSKEFFLWLGNALLAFILVSLVFFSIKYTNPYVFDDFNRYAYLLSLVLLGAVSAFVLEKINAQLLYLFPFSLFALYLLAFFRRRVVIPVYVITLLPLLIFAHNGIQLFVMNLAAGVVTLYTFGFFQKGWLQFVNAMIIFMTLILVYMSFVLTEGIQDFHGYKYMLYMFFGSMLTVAGYPLIYLFEKIFNLVSTSRLIDLTDTNSPILQKMAASAPGTFQHSLQVMNLADAVGRSVDANIPLLRAGALYHDIGKLENPQCFIENEAAGGPKYHQGLSAFESARDILRHVPDGEAMAARYHLPEPVTEFISTHHGTTVTGYFFNRYMNEGGSVEDKCKFQYDGRRPFTKEQVVLMVCDSLEAAARTLEDHSPESISRLVENIVGAKMAEGQFDDAPVTIREIGTMKTTLKQYLQQIYHVRIAYPKRQQEGN